MPERSPEAELESALLSAIRQFFETRDPAPAPAPDESDTVTGRRLQLATAILFLQMIAADQESKHDEHQTLVTGDAGVAHGREGRGDPHSPGRETREDAAASVAQGLA